MSQSPAVAVLMGGVGGEREISFLSGGAVAEALEHEGFRVVRVAVGETLGFAFDGAAELPAARAAAELKHLAQVVFPALHGRFGEDGTLQGFLATLGMPFVGSGVEASALAMNKEVSREIAARLGIAVSRAVAGGGEDLAARCRELSYPLFVKPVRAGSSVGVSRVGGPPELAAALAAALREDCRVLVEEAVAGIEVSCPVLGDAGVDARALPVIEIVPRTQAFFDYEAKYQEGASDEICPARIDPAAAAELRRQALLLHEALGCRGLSRSDFILAPAAGGAPPRPIFLEINTLPGLTPVSLFPKAARAAGMSYGALCAALVRGALRNSSGAT